MRRAEGDSNQGAIGISPKSRGIGPYIIEDTLNVRYERFHPVVLQAVGSVALAAPSLVHQDPTKSIQVIDVARLTPQAGISPRSRV
jgi:hypothetical protein